MVLSYNSSVKGIALIAMMKRALAIILALLLCNAAGATELYLIRFFTLSDRGLLGFWRDDVLFFNTNVVPVDVTLLGVSNGELPPTAPSLPLPPGTLVSLNSNPPVDGLWQPIPSSSFYVLHLNVPNGVIIQSRNEFWTYSQADAVFVNPSTSPLPIFQALTPANALQVHLGTDLGSTDSHVNVGVFNAGAHPATVDIEVLRACDDTVASKQHAVVPANSVIQIGGLPTLVGGDCQRYTLGKLSRIVKVRVSQPSVTFVTNVANTSCSTQSDVPFVGFVVANSARF
jgi:hypothetical protein